MDYANIIPKKVFEKSWINDAAVNYLEKLYDPEKYDKQLSFSDFRAVPKKYGRRDIDKFLDYDIIEERGKGNPYHDSKTGQFTTGKNIAESTNGGTIDLNKRTPGYNYCSNGKPYVPYDSNGEPYRMAQWHLPKREYGKVMGAINTNYYRRFESHTIGHIQVGKFNYDFEIHDYYEYNIYNKE